MITLKTYGARYAYRGRNRAPAPRRELSQDMLGALVAGVAVVVVALLCTFIASVA
jgi:hypothetical protein